MEQVNFQEIFGTDCVLLNLKSGTKEAIIREMADHLVKQRNITDRGAVLQALFEREKQMSTGMQHGIAIPHGKTEAVKDLMAIMALKKEGVDFDSLDGKPSVIFVMTVSPKEKAAQHTAFLAGISKRLNQENVMTRILNAGSEDEVMKILTE